MENTENKQENENNNNNNNKVKMRIYEDQTQIPDFIKINQEPEWMNIIKGLLEKQENIIELKQR